ncbi:hypothetical protein MBLNU459_g8489t1 [Dothideomycetes sp. NU459]
MFVKVTVPPVPEKGKRMSEDFDDVYSDLSQWLGASVTELFSVEVSYRHSLLPKETTLVTSQTCHVQRYNSRSIWGGNADSPHIAYAVKYGKAMYIARNYAPDAALRLLRRKNWSTIAALKNLTSNRKP